MPVRVEERCDPPAARQRRHAFVIASAAAADPPSTETTPLAVVWATTFSARRRRNKVIGQPLDTRWRPVAACANTAGARDAERDPAHRNAVSEVPAASASLIRSHFRGVSVGPFRLGSSPERPQTCEITRIRA
jgi:hypothetical protein